MKRTPLKDRSLPDYTRGEEIMNMVTHIVGGAMGIAVLVIAVVVAAIHHNPAGVVGSAIYGASMIILYTNSSVYHGLSKNCRGKKVMQVIDHCTIYLLIAGSYTPILLSALRPVQPVMSWVVFGVEWGCTALAATLTAIDLKKYKVLSMACYLIMGWFIVIVLKPTLQVLTVPGFLFLLAGGVAYTVGAVLYGLGKKMRYMHSVFHVFVVLGSALQAISVICYAI